MRILRHRIVTVGALVLAMAGCATLLDLPTPVLDDSVGMSEAGSLEAATAEGSATPGDGGDGARGDGGVADVVEEPACDMSLLQNCGACGVDCSNGKCDDGICTLVDMVATDGGSPVGLVAPRAIAIHGDDVYITAGGNVLITRCKTNGCLTPGAERIVAPPSSTTLPDRIVISNNGDALFWSNDHSDPSAGVFRTDPSTGATTMINSGQPTNYAEHIALAGNLVFWTSATESPGAFFCPATGCNGALDAGNTSALRETTAVASTPLGVAWGTDDGLIWVCPTPDCATAQGPLASGQGYLGIHGIGTDGTDLFWGSTSPDHAIRRIPLAGKPDGGGPDTVTTHQSLMNLHSPSDLLVAADMMYWLDPGTENPDGGLTVNGGVHKCRLPACSPVIDVALGQHAPLGLATDGKAIFWVNTGLVGDVGRRGEVRKAPL